VSPYRARLLELLRSHSFERKRVVLASGRESDFFIDCKQTVLLAEGHEAVGRVMLDAVRAAVADGTFAEAPVAVAGVELGGCPLASAVALTSRLADGDPLDAVYVRKTVKDHGSRRQLEGDGHLPDGAPVVVLEDVVTTGGSTLRAVTHLKERFTVVGVVALVDRREGGADHLRDGGLAFTAVFGREDFIPA
jgi:orotate phosphoribosyltransferase